MKNVIIAEKPSVAQSIAAIVGAGQRKDGYLEGNGCAVTWAFGHLVGLAMPEAFSAPCIKEVTEIHAVVGSSEAQAKGTVVNGDRILFPPSPLPAPRISLSSQTKKRNSMTPIIRPIRQNETMLLADFLYEAIYQPDKTRLLPRTVIQRPDLWIYIDGFGSRESDICLVAEVNKMIVGAVWTRLIHACGFVDEHTPELAISVYPAFQDKRIGTRLMQEMLQCLGAKGFRQVSLSVSKDNYAVRMYRRLGFHILHERTDDFLMICPLMTDK